MKPMKPVFPKTPHPIQTMCRDSNGYVGIAQTHEMIVLYHWNGVDMSYNHFNVFEKLEVNQK